MKIVDLAKQYDNVSSKEIIDYLKSLGFEVKSHMQNAQEEWIKAVEEHYGTNVKTQAPKVENKNTTTSNKANVPDRVEKKFNLDDLIPCKSVVPWQLVRTGMDGITVYSWNNFGDEEYVRYRDLQAFRKTDLITAPKVLIEDADLCYQWRRELGDTYKYFLDVEYPEEFFDKTDSEFEQLLTTAPSVLQEVIKSTALEMIRATNYPTVQKLSLIDKILGTCLKDFL